MHRDSGEGSVRRNAGNVVDARPMIGTDEPYFFDFASTSRSIASTLSKLS